MVDKDNFRFLGPYPLEARMPVGDSDHLQQVQIQTVGLTILGMLFLVREIFLKSKDKVVEHSRL